METNPVDNPSDFLTETQLSELLSVACITIRSWRREKRGPRYIKVGRLVRYRRSDIDAWLIKQTVTSLK